jgi:transcriptional regulator with AAA-type ATPase domain
MIKKALDPFEDGDLFLQRFVRGTTPWVQRCRGEIYRINIAQKNKHMVPSILITGEPGVGKGYMAHLIAAHLSWLITSKGQDIDPPNEADVYQLARRTNFRKQMLTALPETLAEAILFGYKKGAFTGAVKDRKGLFDTDGLTDIFLDEIGDATSGVQGRLLDILQTGTFRPLGSSFDEPEKNTEARTIVATNRNLLELVNKREFRLDLYERLQWFRIELPPLREQLDALPWIMADMNQTLCQQYRLNPLELTSSDIKWAQESYLWPGNHRELQQVLWKWNLFEGTLSIPTIVGERNSLTLQSEIVDVLLPHLFQRFEAILIGGEPGFKTYGDYVGEIQNLAYEAIYLFKEKRQLTNDELSKLFKNQKPETVRKQISKNRPQETKQ